MVIARLMGERMWWEERYRDLTWRIWPTLALALALVCGLGACGGRDNTGDYGGALATIEMRAVATATTTEATALHLRLTTPAGAPVAGARVEIEGTMTHAGMQPILVTPTDQGAGRYVAENVRFTMAGDWLIIVRATLPDGGKVQRTFPLGGVREGRSGDVPTTLVAR